uniref:(northern house mosquito) hypothetical protein n=1 Tax=Culex pipiens TaxID=7175 RepID=A0A8D8IU55_CULPI
MGTCSPTESPHDSLTDVVVSPLQQWAWMAQPTAVLSNDRASTSSDHRTSEHLWIYDEFPKDAACCHLSASTPCVPAEYSRYPCPAQSSSASSGACRTIR